MRPLNFFNGWLFLRLKNGNSRHNQYHVTVVAPTKKRALELIHDYSPSASMGFLNDFFSRMDTPPNGLRPIPAAEGIWVNRNDGGESDYVKLTPEILKS